MTLSSFFVSFAKFLVSAEFFKTNVAIKNHHGRMFSARLQKSYQ
jgi:hypothetical protein